MVPAWGRQGLLLLVVGCGLVSSEPDAVVAAARAALDRGQAAEAVYLLDGHAATAAWAAPRLLLARACTQAGRWQRALALVADGSGGLAASWPRHLQGDAAFVLGEALVEAGDGARARPLLAQALRRRCTLVGPDRVIAAIADACGPDSEALQVVCWRRLWEGFPSSPVRPRAGALLIRNRQVAGLADAAVHRIAESLVADATAAREFRLEAGVFLAEAALSQDPAAALTQVQEVRRALGAATVAAGDEALRLVEAVATLRLDVEAGRKVVAALPAEVRGHPRIREAWQAAETRSADADPLSAARRHLALGRVEAARPLLAACAGRQAEALDLLLHLDGEAPERWSQAESAATPAGALALVEAWLRRGDEAKAWEALTPWAARVVDAPVDGLPPRLLLAIARLGETRLPAAHRRAVEALCAAGGGGVPEGMAQVWRARTVLTEAERVAAWMRAATLLPDDHPWAGLAAAEAARPLLADLPPGQAADPADAEQQRRLAQAVTLLAGPARGSDAPACRCRFLLAQAFAQAGRVPEAEACLGSLPAEGDGRRQDLLREFRLRLREQVEQGAER